MKVGDWVEVLPPALLSVGCIGKIIRCPTDHRGLHMIELEESEIGSAEPCLISLRFYRGAFRLLSPLELLARAAE